MTLMKMHMIAGIYQGNSRVGLRILDEDTGKINDVSDAKVKGVLKLGMKIKNVELERDALKWSNGDIKRYPKISNNALEGQSPVIIVNQLGDQGYTVCDYTGKMLKLISKDVINYAQKNGIANGKVSSRDGVQFISAISGYYDYVNISSTIQKAGQAPIKKESEQVKPEQVERPVDNKGEQTTSSHTYNDKKDQVENIAPTVDTNSTNSTIKLSLNEKQLYALSRYYSLYKVDSRTANKEIAELNEAVANNSMKKLYRKTTLLNEILLRLNSTYKIARVYGNELGSIIVLFIDADLALPKSLVLEISRVSLENIQTLYSELFDEFSDAVTEVFKKHTDSFYMASVTYLKRLISHDMLGEYAGYDTNISLAEKQFINKYALCNRFSLPEAATLLGVIDLLSQWDSVLQNKLSDYEYRDTLNGYVNKLLRIAFKYSEEYNINGSADASKTELDAVTYLIESNEMYNDKDSTDVGAYPDLARSLWEIDDEYIKNLGCTYLTTPSTFDELSHNFHSTIDSVYSKLVYCLNIGEDVFITRFIRYAVKQVKIAIDMQKKRDAEELERIARRSIENQQLKRQNTVKQNDSHKTVDVPELQTKNTAGKTRMQLDIESNADLSGYDPIELYKWLKGVTTQDHSTCFIIAEDMVSRNLAYRDMSSRQRYRLDEANKKMLDQYGYKGTRSTPSTKVQNSGNTEENNIYQLSEHPDIKDKIDLLIKKSNDTEMMAVLKDEPNVLKICYSILRYGRASDKQLKHVNNAIRLLEEQ